MMQRTMRVLCVYLFIEIGFNFPKTETCNICLNNLIIEPFYGDDDSSFERMSAVGAGEAMYENSSRR